nr:response regulator transcription factor [Pseudomonas sp. MWU13-3659]
MLKAMIVDDHPFVRSAVKEVLKQESFDVVAQADNGADAVQLARTHAPDLIILDISLPGFDGLEVMARMRNFALNTKVIVLTSFSADLYCRRCMNQGASGFVNKQSDLGELNSAIKAVKAGYAYFPDFSSSSVHKDDHCDDHQLIERLSDRELNILQLLARGANNKTISQDLHLSCKTVSTYKMRLIEKLNVSSLVALADFARRNELI